MRDIRLTESCAPNLKPPLLIFLKRLKYLLPALYIAGAAVVWITFASANPDGLANIGIVLYTFPIVLIGTFVLKLDFPYVPGRYYEAHALYFWPSAVLLALALFLICHALEKVVERRMRNSSGEAE